MILINYAHPIPPAQLEKIGAWVDQPVEVRSVYVQFDPEKPFDEQVRQIVEETGLAIEQWQTESLLINPPAHNVFALTLLAELHGRMGYFPAVLRLKPVKDAVPPRFEVAEIINLQLIRDSSRTRRQP
jgi:hypothetical protein